jgi:hypothetical protein
MKIADRKYYSAVGFYIYGFLAFLPSLIHIICLPDQSDSNARRTSKGAVVMGAVGGIVSIYRVAFMVLGPTRALDLSGMPVFAFAEAFFILVEAVLVVWLMVCMYSCNRGRGIRMNFVVSAVVALAKMPIISIAFTISAVSANPTVHFGLFFLNQIIHSYPSVINGISQAVAYIILAVFIDRLNSGKPVMPKAAYCLLPAALVFVSVVITGFIMAPVFMAADIGGAISHWGLLIFFLTVGGYCWIASNIPTVQTQETNYINYN